jgi:hypothetical protein
MWKYLQNFRETSLDSPLQFQWIGAKSKVHVISNDTLGNCKLFANSE